MLAQNRSGSLTFQEIVFFFWNLRIVSIFWDFREIFYISIFVFNFEISKKFSNEILPVDTQLYNKKENKKFVQLSIFVKFSIFCQIFNFFVKLSIFCQIFIFFVKLSIFLSNFQFFVKLSIFCQIFIFL